MSYFKTLSQIASVIAVIFCIVFFNTVYSETVKLSDLLTAIASSSEKTAQFTETRAADFLAVPLVSTGLLEFKAPDTLIKKVTSPNKMQQRIIGDELTLITETVNDSGEIDEFDNSQVLSLSSYPELEIGINAIRWVLSGNLVDLQKNFKVIYANNNEGWQITLHPKDAEILERIQNLIIIGKAQHITQIKITQENGESLITDLYEHH